MTLWSAPSLLRYESMGRFVRPAVRLIVGEDAVVCVADHQFARSPADGVEICDAAGLVDSFASHPIRSVEKRDLPLVRVGPNGAGTGPFGLA